MIFMHEYVPSFLKSIKASKEGKIVWSLTHFSFSKLTLIVILTMLLIESSTEQGCDLDSSTPWIFNDTYLQSFIDNSSSTDVCFSSSVSTSNQDLVSVVCNSTTRTQAAMNRSLRFCDTFSMYNTLQNHSCLHSYSDCVECALQVDDVDRSAQLLFSTFKSVLDRFDCNRSKFSVNWDCDNCLNVYKNWVCAMVIPNFVNGTLVRPSIDFCTEVERQCPYLLPKMDTLYGGHPSFICNDLEVDNHSQQEQVYGQKDNCHRIGLEIPENVTSTSSSAILHGITLVKMNTLITYCVLQTLIYLCTTDFT